MTGSQDDYRLNSHKLSRLDDWMQAVRSKPRYQELMEGLIPAKAGGIILLGGRTGLGKTNLALQIAFSVAAGKDFLGHKTKQSQVGYLGFEGSQDKMADRVDKLLRQFPGADKSIHFALTIPKVLSYGNINEFATWFRGVDLIVLDPLKYLVVGDYIKPADAQLFLSNVYALSDNVGAPVLLCHHIRKPNPQAHIDPGDLYELKGAGDYVDAATTVLLLEYEKQGHKNTGGFAPVNRDNMTLFFPKTRDAVTLEEPILLTFDRQRLLFRERSALDLIV